jgi:two-component system chemotaxis sensor kinase CheA
MAATDALRIAFFEECEDLLARLGEGLARMADAGDTPDIETVHEVFRAVHSVKGGAAAFGLTSLVNFAHVFETVLDHMRAGRLAAGQSAMHTLLRSFDVLSDLVAVARDGGTEPSQMAALFVELDVLADGGGNDESDAEIEFEPIVLDIFAGFGTEDPEPALAAGQHVTFGPGCDFYAAGHEPVALLRSLARLGEARIRASVADVPILSELDLSRPSLRWEVEFLDAVAPEEIEAVFEFVGDLAQLKIAPLTKAQPAAASSENAGDDAVDKVASEPEAEPETPSQPGPVRAVPEAGATPLQVTATIRVNLDRVDRLINQIGELVIMEAMLSQAISGAGLRDDSEISNSLEGIKQLAASIQESVMSIRAQPLKPVFQRMQRIAREASDATGKQVRLQTLGESTEVDKTVIERLVDPLTHMIRNSVDHGIESSARRVAAGKTTEGTITLSAAHRSGRVIIEVADDGGGIDRVRVREVAEARGLISPDAQLAPIDIDNLLFLPGFSSKAEVSALSGRGVGLDVVRREIQALGGRVTIQSTPGSGTTFTIALPLTLAVLEGMLIGVGSETMVLPLSSIVETLRPTESQIHSLGRSGRLIANRGELIPIIDLAESFDLASTDLERAVLIVVECDSGRLAALAVDRIHDQRQVVIKSLEDNYGSIPGISAATILGDGRIALIIDPEEIVQRAAGDSLARAHAVNG